MANVNNTSPLRLCVMHGDGIGPEIMAATLAVLRAAGGDGRSNSCSRRWGRAAPLQSEGTTFPEARSTPQKPPTA